MALLQVRLDDDLKEEAGAALEAMGLSMSDAVRMMLTIVADERVLPFTPRAPCVLCEQFGHIPNAKTIAAMQEPLEGRKSFSSAAELMADLESDDEDD